MQPTRRATIYCRVSTDRQAAEGVSLEAQRDRALAWCAGNGFEPGQVFVDAGLSGGRADNRPELQRALELVTRERGVLVVYSLSRLSRSTRDTLEIADKLERAGADLVSLTERLDTTSATGRLVFGFFALLAQHERDLTAERTRAALAFKRSRGERTGGQVPFGYALDVDGVHLVENAAEQRVLSRILELRAAGATYRAIAEQLAGEGHATRNGGTWSAKVLRGICTRDPIQVAA